MTDDRCSTVTAKVSKYLSELPSSSIVDGDNDEMQLMSSTDASPLSSFNGGGGGDTKTNSTRSASPFYTYIQPHSPSSTRRQSPPHYIPTRASTKITNEIAHNPLQFITANTNAYILAEQAKQQIQMSDEQRKMNNHRPNTNNVSTTTLDDNVCFFCCI